MRATFLPPLADRLAADAALAAVHARHGLAAIAEGDPDREVVAAAARVFAQGPVDFLEPRASAPGSPRSRYGRELARLLVDARFGPRPTPREIEADDLGWLGAAVGFVLGDDATHLSLLELAAHAFLHAAVTADADDDVAFAGFVHLDDIRRELARRGGSSVPNARLDDTPRVLASIERTRGRDDAGRLRGRRGVFVDHLTRAAAPAELVHALGRLPFRADRSRAERFAAERLRAGVFDHFELDHRAPARSCDTAWRYYEHLHACLDRTAPPSVDGLDALLARRDWIGAQAQRITAVLTYVQARHRAVLARWYAGRLG